MLHDPARLPDGNVRIGANDFCPKDFDGDGAVGFRDVLAVLTHWGGCP